MVFLVQTVTAVPVFMCRHSHLTAHLVILAAAVPGGMDRGMLVALEGPVAAAAPTRLERPTRAVAAEAITAAVLLLKTAVLEQLS
jgi:hypothetical protein